MKSLSILALLLAASMAHELFMKQNNCVFTDSGMVWNLGDLVNKDENYEILFEDTIKDKKGRDMTVNKTISFNFCREAFPVNNTAWDSNYHGYAYESWTDDTGAMHFNYLTQNFLENSKKNVSIVQDDTNNRTTAHIMVDYESNQECGSNTTFYGITFEYMCGTNDSPLFIPVTTKGCHPVVNVISSDNCVLFDTNALWRWVEKFWWITAISMIVVGGFEATLGQKLFKPTLFIIGALTVLCLVLFIFFAWFLPVTTASWVVWVIGAIGLILGIIAGYFMAKLARIGICAIGAWCGVVIGFLVHETVLYAAEQQWLFWLMIVCLGLVFGLVAFWKYRQVLIFGTAFMGSYLFVRGFSLFFGGYPNEFTLIEKMKNGETDYKHWPFYLYLITILVVTVAGTVVQFKLKKNSDRTDKFDYYTRV